MLKFFGCKFIFKRLSVNISIIRLTVFWRERNLYRGFTVNEEISKDLKKIKI